MTLTVKGDGVPWQAVAGHVGDTQLAGVVGFADKRGPLHHLAAKLHADFIVTCNEKTIPAVLLTYIYILYYMHNQNHHHHHHQHHHQTSPSSIMINIYLMHYQFPSIISHPIDIPHHSLHYCHHCQLPSMAKQSAFSCRM